MAPSTAAAAAAAAATVATAQGPLRRSGRRVTKKEAKKSAVAAAEKVTTRARLAKAKKAETAARPGHLKANLKVKSGPTLLTIPLDVLTMIFDIICEEESPDHGAEENDSAEDGGMVAVTTAALTGATDDTRGKGALVSHRSRRQATNFLLTCSHIYGHLAPMYWQKRTVIFTDPVNLANDFLGFASDMAIVGLRDLQFNLKVNKLIRLEDWLVRTPRPDQSPTVALLIRNINKFREVLALYHSELKGLRSFTVKLSNDLFLPNLISKLAADTEDGASNGSHSHASDFRSSAPSARQIWSKIDRLCNGCLGNLEKTIGRTLFKGSKHFHITATMDTKRESAIVRSSLLGVEIQMRTVCQNLTLTFERED